MTTKMYNELHFYYKINTTVSKIMKGLNQLRILQKNLELKEKY